MLPDPDMEYTLFRSKRKPAKLPVYFCSISWYNPPFFLLFYLLLFTFYLCPGTGTLAAGASVPHLLKRKNLSSERFSEATIGFEPMMRVLQTLALPLGHVAVSEKLPL